MKTLTRPYPGPRLDYAEKPYLEGQRVTQRERQPGAPLLLLAVLGVFSGSVMIALALYRIVAPLTNWIMQGLR